MERTRATDATLFLLAGCLVGAGLALLFAPQSGRELRDLATEKGRELIEGARQGLAWQRERLAAAVDAGRQTYQEEKSQA